MGKPTRNVEEPLFIITILVSLSVSVNAEGIFDKPFATCSSIKSLGAYKTASAVVNRCEKYGVHINLKKAKSGFDGMLTEEEFSPSECRANCMVLSALNNTEMSSCVEKTHVDPFVGGFMGSLTFNKDNCQVMKTKLGG